MIQYNTDVSNGIYGISFCTDSYEVYRYVKQCMKDFCANNIPKTPILASGNKILCSNCKTVVCKLLPDDTQPSNLICPKCNTYLVDANHAIPIEELLYLPDEDDSE